MVRRRTRTSLDCSSNAQFRAQFLGEVSAICESGCSGTGVLSVPECCQFSRAADRARRRAGQSSPPRGVGSLGSPRAPRRCCGYYLDRQLCSVEGSWWSFERRLVITLFSLEEVWTAAADAGVDTTPSEFLDYFCLKCSISQQTYDSVQNNVLSSRLNRCRSSLPRPVLRVDVRDGDPTRLGRHRYVRTGFEGVEPVGTVDSCSSCLQIRV